MFKFILFASLIVASFSINAMNRNIVIHDRAGLDEEMKYLSKNFDAEKPDTLIRLVDYAMRHSDERGYILNNFAMKLSKDTEKMNNIQFIVDYISNHIVSLDNNNIPKNGEWSGQSGHSNFFIDGDTKSFSRNEVRQAAPQGIPFEYGYPNFSKFKIGESIPIKNPSGSYEFDYEKVVENLIFEKKSLNGMIFNSKEELNEYFQSNYADLQYSLHDNTFELIPNIVSSVIDYKVPHISKRKPH